MRRSEHYEMRRNWSMGNVWKQTRLCLEPNSADTYTFFLIFSFVVFLVVVLFSLKQCLTSDSDLYKF